MQIACILSGIPYNNAQSIYTFYTNNTKYSVVSVKDKEETKLYLFENIIFNLLIKKQDGHIINDSNIIYLPLTSLVPKLSFTSKDSTTDMIDYENHYFYYGENADKSLQIPDEVLPPNTTVKIVQMDNRYLFHYYRNGTIGQFNEKEMSRLPFDYLKANRYIN